eukprot:TRINITY_DN64282_c4_g1_i1.p1 TRINITY_DN64282_c4_g1~~TRINITY_DN64282_c4_g1_i1.p1  ORF type:complete len:972 (-),score=63.93 TRINITY_DN64282_c4_g1_i1:4540-7368(-)
MWKAEMERALVSLGLKQTVVQNAFLNKRLTERLQAVLAVSSKFNSSTVSMQGTRKRTGPLLYKVATKVPPGFERHLEFLAQYIAQGKLRTDAQVEAAIAYIKSTTGEKMDIPDFEQRCGVGVIVTKEEIREVLHKLFEQNKGSKFNFAALQYDVRKHLKWADGKIVAEEIEILKQKCAVLPHSTAKPSKEESKRSRLSKHLARDLPSALNSLHLLEEHRKAIPYPVVTRFPPEPNGFLHIGHAKAMRYNFTLAEDYDGVCYLRYDDTNPEKEHSEYIENIKECVEWLGYKPWKVTYASDYFDKLFEFAVSLIKSGKAYVCHQTKEELGKSRAEEKESPWRNRPPEESLELFYKMKEGAFKEQEAMLRLKVDMKHSNPCMRDPVAYRIKHMAHPRSGEKWCIYPTYDFTHCINDSLEHITHSCCTLEFEIRRDSYYWLLNALNIYRPYVWEFSRLNISHNVLSKRLLKALIEEGFVKGWDDPRLLTLMGLKRRGVTPAAINEFCDLVGVTRRGNEMVVSQNLLDYCVRKDLNEKAPRTMAVLEPLLVVLVNVEESYEEQIETSLFLKYPERGKQTCSLTKRIFIDRNDYKPEGDPNFYGLTKTQRAVLKSAGWIKLIKEVKDSKGELQYIEAEFCKIKEGEKVKAGVLHWVAEKYSLEAEVRIYDKLFLCDNPKELGVDWKKGVNKNSLKVLKNARVWDKFTKAKHLDCFQFERIGYFVIDYDSNMAQKKYVFNQTVALSESKDKKKLLKGKSIMSPSIQHWGMRQICVYLLYVNLQVKKTKQRWRWSLQRGMHLFVRKHSLNTTKCPEPLQQPKPRIIQKSISSLYPQSRKSLMFATPYILVLFCTQYTKYSFFAFCLLILPHKPQTVTFEMPQCTIQVGNIAILYKQFICDETHICSKLWTPSTQRTKPSTRRLARPISRQPRAQSQFLPQEKSDFRNFRA